MSVERDRIGHEESQPRDPKHFTLNLCLILHPCFPSLNII